MCAARAERVLNSPLSRFFCPNSYTRNYSRTVCVPLYSKAKRGRTIAKKSPFFFRLLRCAGLSACLRAVGACKVVGVWVTYQPVAASICSTRKLGILSSHGTRRSCFFFGASSAFLAPSPAFPDHVSLLFFTQTRAKRAAASRVSSLPPPPTTYHTLLSRQHHRCSERKACTHHSHQHLQQLLWPPLPSLPANPVSSCQHILSLLFAAGIYIVLVKRAQPRPQRYARQIAPPSRHC